MYEGYGCKEYVTEITLKINEFHLAMIHFSAPHLTKCFEVNDICFNKYTLLYNCGIQELIGPNLNKGLQ